jgi:hypothetical protein
MSANKQAAILFVLLPLGVYLCHWGYSKIEFDRATHLAAKYGISAEAFRDFVDEEGTFPSNEKEIKETLRARENDP